MLDKEFLFPTSRSEIVESEDKPIMKFEVFYQFYQTSMIWNKILILEKKHLNMYERRELMKKYNMQEYKIKCAQFNMDDELCL